MCAAASKKTSRSKAAAVRKPRADGLETRARILDTAEALFAARGYHGTSVRDITEQAGLRLAAVNYHFVSKETLLRDVLLRRADALAQDRIALLAEVFRERSVAARVRALVRAFVVPVERYAASSEGFRNYFALSAQVASSRLEALSLVADHFNPNAQRFVDAIGRIFPRATQGARHHAFQFMLGATLYAFSGNGRLESMTGGSLRSDDYERIARNLIAFVSAGVRACCGEATAKSGEDPSEGHRSR